MIDENNLRNHMWYRLVQGVNPAIAITGKLLNVQPGEEL